MTTSGRARFDYLARFASCDLKESGLLRQLKSLAILLAISFLGVIAVAQAAPLSAQETRDQDNIEYRLGAGDKVRVLVYNEQDLSGEFEVDGAGQISLPLIGTLKVSGLTVTEVERQVGDKLANGFLINPQVSLEIMNYRPFYILGEVKQPGSYDYVNGMTILNAVALAGGFTPRAQERKIEVTRKDGDKEIKLQSAITAKVLPGDIIRIPQRLF
ncbi:polysaccharide biosynthesis/export family protein [Gimibacter soli]|uniref:Polysaccharide export protein n=1 Tax=Gimibacter soli TaxID=3024400 RepID=A0AAF0BLQ2_9PROT|nr:polysaccharide biosynthesis/export family protein [Gimibacter soli]WCL53386.1 polysaccharide export protein [Gimibacter soli]